MMSLLFSSAGRLNRAKVWLALLYYAGASILLGVLLTLLWQLIPGTVGEDGSFNVSGPVAIPYLALSFGYVVAMIWSGICVGIKRYHDRDKSGVWILIQFAPVIGPIWYFIEVMCLAGTAGPNRFGPDPLASQGQPVGPGFSPAN